MSAYRLKAKTVIINGEVQKIIPGDLPSSPTNGMYAIDSSDYKLKVYVADKNRWVILGDAEDQYFDNSDNEFEAENVQEAIEEAAGYVDAKARYATHCGFDGTASSGRYLEFVSNVGSDVSGHVVNENATLVGFAASVSANATVTFTIYKNGASVGTLSFSSQRKKSTAGLSIPLAATDELSVKVSSGSCSKPNFSLFIRIDG